MTCRYTHRSSCARSLLHIAMPLLQRGRGVPFAGCNRHPKRALPHQRRRHRPNMPMGRVRTERPVRWPIGQAPDDARPGTSLYGEFGPWLSTERHPSRESQGFRSPVRCSLFDVAVHFVGKEAEVRSGPAQVGDIEDESWGTAERRSMDEANFSLAIWNISFTGVAGHRATAELRMRRRRVSAVIDHKNLKLAFSRTSLPRQGGSDDGSVDDHHGPGRRDPLHGAP